MKKALIAMSGGVDSSVAAYLMKQAGYDCIGATMRLFHNEDAGISHEKTCCSLEDTEDARSVAYKLGIPFYVFNFTDDFTAQVIDRFVSAYERGITPNPCIDCNRFLKFDRLYRRGRELGLDYLVTGHYARIELYSGRYYLKKALDTAKDQSYVLYSLSQEQLAHTQFPLGGMRKTETRCIAEEQGFVNAHKRDSQDICFVPDGDYAKIIELHAGKRYPRGTFVDTHGNVIGEHKGIIHYTIGQRKGIGISSSEPLYVCEKRLLDNTIELGHRSELYASSLDAADFNWIAFDAPPEKLRVKAKIRYRQDEQWAWVFATEPNAVHVEFDLPQRAISSGQSIVLYDGDAVVGGGTIC
ncbi:MAG: tRNA 2-thiouridine(34) synthase MnmA [Clostridiaceae bacterium]|nr:tRNA 2-thiouridine(34) synthase MnmA [Clostridiaceae bacterium]